MLYLVHRLLTVIYLQVFRSRLRPTQPPKIGTDISLPQYQRPDMKMNAVPQLVQIVKLRGWKLSLTAVMSSVGFRRRLLGLTNTIVHY